MSTTKKLSEEPIINISNNIESSSSSPSSEEISFDISPESSSNKSSSFLDKIKSFFQKLNYRIIAIILILLFLGINIFTYLGNSLDYAKDTFSPLFGGFLKSFALTTGDLTKQTVEVSGEGIKGATDIATGTITSGIDVLEGQVDRNSDTQSKQTKTVNNNSSSANNIDNTSDYQNTPSNQNDMSQELNTALAHAESSIPSPDDATSNTQKSSSNKSGYCYIGEDRGFRSCIKVNENDVCMSGDIFGSEAICINPNLRE
jgi:hypothetical protein